MALTAKKVYAILKRQISDMEAKLNSPVRYRGTFGLLQTAICFHRGTEKQKPRV